MDNFIVYIGERIAEAEKEERKLIESARKDEANLVKVKTNIYGVCRTIYEVAVKSKSPEELESFYLGKLSGLAESWSASYEKAKKFDDVEKIVIEEIKLQTLKEVEEWFKKEKSGCRKQTQ